MSRSVRIHVDVELADDDPRSDSDLVRDVQDSLFVASEGSGIYDAEGDIGGPPLANTTFQATPAEGKPVIVVTRHPDFADEISVHGFQARVIYIDLGSSFDSKPDNDEQAREWADAVLDSIADLPDDHPARLEVEGVVSEACDRLDGEVEEIIQRHRRPT